MNLPLCHNFKLFQQMYRSLRQPARSYLTTLISNAGFLSVEFIFTQVWMKAHTFTAITDGMKC
jgi:hypothetical protein